MKIIWQCMFSPRLYKVYRDGPRDQLYQPRPLEKWGDRIITTANTLLNIGLYTSPFICMYIYKRDYFSMEEMQSIGHFFGGIACVMAFAFILRSCGRVSNAKYVQFIKALNAPMTNKKTYLTDLRKYDFDFYAWPVTYSVASKEKSSWLDPNPFKTTANRDLPGYQRAVIQLLAFIATHTFALRLVYPGSIIIIRCILWTALFEGRVHLVEVYDGLRAKIKSADGNTIDTMFVDNRLGSDQGKTLVICCEGNSGFYEIGIMSTPIKCGYSALGWNHPGFSGSTGLPYPSQEQNAIDVVMQYAIEELGFNPENIVMYGWSIGGYTAAWAAVNYPVGGLLLDATFDDLLPLAENHMPSSWSLLVKEVIRSYLDLNIAALVAKYQGPLQLIRRTEDEVIALRQGHLASNRGNNLVVKVLAARHPEIVTTPITKLEVLKLLAIVDPSASGVTSATTAAPVTEKERNLRRLIKKYMRDYKSSHCTPLPDNDFVQVMDYFESIKYE